MLEIFEWASEKHTKIAHKDKVVRKFWLDMEKIWTSGGFNWNKVPESKEPFAHFELIDI